MVYIQEAITSLLHQLGYLPEAHFASTEDNLYGILLSEFQGLNDGGKWFDGLCRVAAIFAQSCYSEHKLEDRLQCARSAWFTIRVDDQGAKSPSLLTDFHRRLVCKIPTSNPSLTPEEVFEQAFQDHLTSFYRTDNYDKVAVNCIITATLDFLNGSAFEEVSSMRNMKLSDEAISWPYYRRNKTGLGIGYSILAFPGVSMSVYVQVVDDMGLYASLGNDLLSFYKEERADEKTITFAIERALHASPNRIQ